jgi:hypothetical protein
MYSSICDLAEEKVKLMNATLQEKKLFPMFLHCRNELGTSCAVGRGPPGFLLLLTIRGSRHTLAVGPERPSSGAANSGNRAYIPGAVRLSQVGHRAVRHKFSKVYGKLRR